MGFKKVIRSTTASLFFVMAGSVSIMAQTSTTTTDTSAQTPADPQLAALEAERARLEAQTKTIEAELSLRQKETELLSEDGKRRQAKIENALAGLPVSEFKGFEGQIGLEKASVSHSEILAYRALADVSKEIATKICANKGTLTQVYIGNVDTLFAAASQKAAVETQLALLQEQLDETEIRLSGKPKGTNFQSELVSSTAVALQAIPKVAGAVSDVTKLFRSDTTLTGIEITINDRALVSALTEEVLAKNGCGLAVVDPSITIVAEEMPIDKKMKNVRESLAKLMLQKPQIEQSYNIAIASVTANLKNINQKITDITNVAAASDDKIMTPEQAKKYNDFLDDRQGYEFSLDVATKSKEIFSAQMSTLQTDTTAILNGLTTQEGDNLPIIRSIALWEALSSEGAADAAFLSVNAESVGGQSIVTKSGFSSAKLNYSGSVVISYRVVKTDGSIILAGIGNATKSERADGKRGFIPSKG